MLRENIKQHIRHEKVLRDESPRKPLAGSQRALYHRVKRDALKGIEDLTFLLENLPEKQLEQIFTAEIMRKFFNVLLSLESDNLDSRRERVKSLWRLILYRGADYGIKLIGKDSWRALTSRMNSEIEALYYSTLG